MASDAPILGKTRELRARRRPVTTWVVVMLGAAVLCYALPPVRFVRKGAHELATSRPTNIAASAEQAWDGRLKQLSAQAVDAEELLSAIRADRDAACATYARRVGVGGSYYYFFTGVGSVIKKSNSRVDLALEPAKQDADVSIEIGNIFGNALRDGTGVFKIGDYENSRDFNQLSQELNSLVETRVLPTLREKVMVGSEVRFTGVAEVADEDLDLRPLRVVPIAAEVK